MILAVVPRHRRWVMSASSLGPISLLVSKLRKTSRGVQEAAASAEGCYGARLTGAGFGGCVTAITSEAAAGHVRERTAAAFERRFGRRPELHTCRVGTGAGIVTG